MPSVAVMLAVSACSDDDSPITVPTCNTLADDGPPVTATAVSATAPAPAGGTIEDGTYELTAMTLYGGTSADLPPGTVSVVVEVTGSVMQQVIKINGSAGRYTTNFTTSGTSISLVDSCPKWTSETHSFSATPTDHRMYDTGTAGVLEQVYTKR